MSTKTLSMTPPLYAYFQAVSLRETDVMKQLREETLKTGWERMQISPEQGQFLAFLIEMMGASRVLEIGTFTGYSALCMAAALPEDGSLLCCDVNEEWTSIGKRFWALAGVADKIELKLAFALETIQTLLSEGQEGSFDFVFIDADKENYNAYYEHSLQLLRKGGVVAIDNVFWSGDVADPAKQDKETQAIREVTQAIHLDQRVSLSLVPIGDGLLLARKR